MDFALGRICHYCAGRSFDLTVHEATWRERLSVTETEGEGDLVRAINTQPQGHWEKTLMGDGIAIGTGSN